MCTHTLYTCSELINTCTNGYDKYIHLSPKKIPNHSWIVLVPHTGVVCVGYACVCVHAPMCASFCTFPNCSNTGGLCNSCGTSRISVLPGVYTHTRWVQKVFTHKCFAISSHKDSPNPENKTFLQMTKKRNWGITWTWLSRLLAVTLM